jgi:hypothetical protein
VGTARPQYLEAQELGTSRPNPAREWSLTRVKSGIDYSS